MSVNKVAPFDEPANGLMLDPSTATLDDTPAAEGAESENDAIHALFPEIDADTAVSPQGNVKAFGFAPS